MTDGNAEVIRLAPAEPKLRIREYDSSSRRASVEFDPPVRFRYGETKYKVGALNLHLRDIRSICPGMNGNGSLKTGSEFIYDGPLTRSLFGYKLERNFGYGLKILGYKEGVGFEVSFRTGREIRQKEGTIKPGSRVFTLEQLQELNDSFKRRKPKKGYIFAVDRKTFERVYNSLGGKTKKITTDATDPLEGHGAPAINVFDDDDIDPEGSGVREGVSALEAQVGDGRVATSDEIDSYLSSDKEKD